MYRIHRRFVSLIFVFHLFVFGGVITATAQEKEENFKPENKLETASAKLKEEKTEKTDENSGEEKTEPVTAAPEKIEHFRAPAFSANLARVGVNPSQTTPLTLNETIRRALENNNDIEVARNDVQINEQTLRSLEGIYDPVFSVTPTFTRNTGSRQGRSTNDFSLNLGFDQFLPIGGGRITPFFNNSRTGSFFSSNLAGSGGNNTQVVTNGAFFNSSLGVQYTQPLFRNRAIDNTRRNIQIQRKRIAQSDIDFRRQTIETISRVQQAYWDLVFALRDQQNRVANLNLTKENMRRVEAQITAGAAAPLARAEVGTELANRESDLLIATQSVTTAENALKQLLLRDPASPEWSQQILPTDEPNFDATPIKLEDALADARSNRPELQRLNLQREINDIDLRYFRNQVKPQIDFVSTFSLNGFTQSIPGAPTTSTNVPLFLAADRGIDPSAYLFEQVNVLRERLGLMALTQSNIPAPTIVTQNNGLTGGFAQSIRNLFNSNSPTVSVGVTIGFPLRNKSAKADLAGAQIQRTQLDAQSRQQEQIVIAEVRNAVQSVETARQRVLTARRARENAEIQLQGEQKLYEVGRSTTFLLFQRENALANARNAEIRSQTDYNKALAELQRSTSTTLRSNNIVIESFVKN